MGFSELLGELSVHIFSLSLSDSSPYRLPRRLDGRVKEAIRGLWSRVSEKYAALGASILGRRKRTRSGLISSVPVIGEPGAIALEEEGGKAKSEDDVGNDGLVDVPGMLPSALGGLV